MSAADQDTIGHTPHTASTPPATLTPGRTSRSFGKFHVDDQNCNLLYSVAGKSLIGWYIGSSAVASTYGAAGALMVLLLWVYYSVQTFLLGAELTKAFANRHGSKQSNPVPEKQTNG